MAEVKKDLLNLLREEDSKKKRKDLMDKLVRIVDFLWETKSDYKQGTPKKELEELKSALFNSTFHFSSMYRSWIPKPNRPGKMRAITQPHKGDIIVIEALSLLLNIVFEDLFLPQSHGFRKGRGPITFLYK